MRFLEQAIARDDRRRFPAGRLWLLGLALALSGCSGRPAEPETPQRVLLISLDTLRADRIHAYGHSRETTPFLDRLAAEGARFDAHFSQAVSTLPAHASVFLSQYLAVHGVRHRGRIIDSQQSLVEELASGGFATAGLVSGGYVSQEFGFDRGFESYRMFRRQGLEINRKALEWLGNGDPRKRFLFLHYMTAHAPYVEPNPYRESYGAEYRGTVDGSGGTVREISRFRSSLRGRLTAEDKRHLSDLYDDGVSHLDQQLAQLFSDLEAAGLLEKTLVIFFSDHGECLFDHHDHLEHGRLLYDELVRVPLIVWGPEWIRPVVVEDLTESIDIMPTILDFVGLDFERLPAVQGRSLRPLLQPDSETARPWRRFVFSEEISGRFDRRMIRDREWKLIVDFKSRETELYSLAEDPGERRNLKDEHPEKVAVMARELDRWVAAGAPLRVAEPEEAVLEEATARQLRALGYID